MARKKQQPSKRLGAKMPSTTLRSVAGEAIHLTALRALCEKHHSDPDSARTTVIKLHELDEKFVYFLSAGDASKCMNIIYEKAGKGCITTYGSAAFEYEENPQVSVIPDGFKMAFYYSKRLFYLEIGVTRDHAVNLCFRCMDLTEGANPAHDGNWGPWCALLEDAMIKASAMAPADSQGKNPLRQVLECSFISRVFWSSNVRERVGNVMWEDVIGSSEDDSGGGRVILPAKPQPETDEGAEDESPQEPPWKRASGFECDMYESTEPVFDFMMDDEPALAVSKLIEKRSLAAQAARDADGEELRTAKKAKVDAAEDDDDIEYVAQSPAY